MRVDSFAESGRGLAMAKAAVDVLTCERHDGDNAQPDPNRRVVT
jgi:hypothetical protein